MRVLTEVKLTLFAPLTIAKERRSSVPESLEYIAGSVLRGAVLSAWRRVYGEDAVFDRMVEPDRCRFPYLWPGPEGTTPFPRSAYSCKRMGPEHGVVDVLFARAIAGKTTATLDDMKRVEEVFRCPEKDCGEDRKPVEGYRSRNGYAPSITRTMRMNVGISRRTGATERGVLFGSECVEPIVMGEDGQWMPLTFSGIGSFHENDLLEIEKLAKERIFVGKSRSCGRGEAQVCFSRVVEPVARTKEIEESSKRITQILKIPKGTAFTLDTISPLVAFDEYLRATTEPADWLPSDLGVTVVDAIVAEETVTGWDMATRLPKEEDVVVSSGSTVLAYSELPISELAKRLAQIERDGLGERLVDGFGQVRVNDDFHFKSWR